MKIKTLKLVMSLTMALFGLSACGLDFGQNEGMSEAELKFYLLGAWYYERELHCSYYPKDCPSEEEEVIIVTQANDPDDEEKVPVTSPTDPNRTVAYGFDTNGDGYVDVVAADTDGDGLADKVLYIDDEDKVEPEDEIEIADCQTVTTKVDDEEVTAKLCGGRGGK